MGDSIERTDIAQQGFDRAAQAARDNAQRNDPINVMDVPEVKEHFENEDHIVRGSE